MFNIDMRWPGPQGQGDTIRWVADTVDEVQERLTEILFYPQPYEITIASVRTRKRPGRK